MTATLQAIAERAQARASARRDLPSPAVRREIRTAAGVSLEEVAGVCGVTRGAVAFWEAGTRTPHGKNLEAYMAVLRALREAVDST